MSLVKGFEKFWNLALLIDLNLCKASYKQKCLIQGFPHNKSYTRTNFTRNRTKHFGRCLIKFYKFSLSKLMFLKFVKVCYIRRLLCSIILLHLR